jgi:hypothetical protein
MARQTGIAPENNFSKGLITEATGLNFPENACTETYDCVFDPNGSIYRRKGFNYESSFTTTQVTRNSSAMVEYVWDSVAGNGNKQLVVLQIGNILHFYDVGDTTNLSTRKKSFTINLNSYLSVGATTTASSPCQFSTGSGRLFVVNPFMTPIYIVWNNNDTLTVYPIAIKIRDFAGVTSTADVDFRPTTLTSSHKYNLFNQGWYVDKVDSVNFATNGLNPIVAWDSSRTDFPSNADVWWVFKDSNDQMNQNFISRVALGSTPAPKGHFVLDAFDQKRGSTPISGVSAGTVTTLGPHPFVVGQTVTIFGNTNSSLNTSFVVATTPSDSTFTIAGGLTGTGGTVWSSDLTYTTSGSNRPSVVSFYAGRIFYGGVNTAEYNNNIYFSRTIESEKDYGFCMQINDPSSEENSDLYPTDGGVISIPEMGNLIRMISVGSDLICFASNGVWQLSGSKGLQFAANDYSVRRLSSIPAISATSFVVVEGYPLFWNNDGIYLVKPNQVGDLSVENITNETIADFYTAIPTKSKYYAKGTYDVNEKIVSWMYASGQILGEGEAFTNAVLDDSYTYDRVLSFNTLTGAFYPWTIQRSSSSPKVNGAVVIQYAGIYVPTVKYLSTVQVTSTLYNATWSEPNNETYLDWVATNHNLNYTSYFVTGYKLSGQAIADFQKNYIVVYCKRITNASLNLRGRWNYSTSGNSGLWTTSQEVYLNQPNTDFVMRRVKIRGEGRACQLAFTSSIGKPFHVIGWASFESTNTGP